MLFSSMVFLWIFLPFTIIGNYLLRKNIRCKNIFLLICSLVFYAWGGIYYLLIMLGVILINFVGGRAVQRNPVPRKKKRVLVWTIVFNIAILFFFKYFNMVIAIVETVLSVGKADGETDFWSGLWTLQGTGELGIAQIALPIGISFFIFQALSYVIDVYRGEVEAQKNILDFALYVALFPQLIAGPIVQYADVAAQLNERRETQKLFIAGQKRFCYGLGKKVLIANTLGSVADQIWALPTEGLGAALAWLGAISYTLQIYYDFSGYSDMAIGLGRMLGFRFKENFKYPYMSLSIQEFWRRWHISLSSWFKNYIYIPLGGSRKGMAMACRNTFIVFLLTGIWHGANFTFLFWGLMYAGVLIVERLFLGRILEKNSLKLLNRIYVMAIVMLGWILFRSDNVLVAGEFIRQLFAFEAGEYSVLSYLSMQVLLAILFGILGGGILQRLFEKTLVSLQKVVLWRGVTYSLQIAVLVACILLLVAGTYNPFIYFQF